MPVATYHLLHWDGATSAETRDTFRWQITDPGGRGGQDNLATVDNGHQMWLGAVGAKGTNFFQSVGLFSLGERYARGLTGGATPPGRGATVNSVTLRATSQAAVAAAFVARAGLAIHDGRWSSLEGPGGGWAPDSSNGLGEWRARIEVDSALYKENGSGASIRQTTFSNIPGYGQEYGQTFTVDGGPNIGNLTQISIYGQRQGSPTGAMICRVYQTDSNGKPTGSAIAQSAIVDVSTVSTTLGLIDFAFTGSDSIDLDDYEGQNLTFGITFAYTFTGTANEIEIRYFPNGATTNFGGQMQVFAGDKDGGFVTSAVMKDRDLPYMTDYTANTDSSFVFGSGSQTFTYPITSVGAAMSASLPTGIFQEWFAQASYPFEDQVLALMLGNGSNVATSQGIIDGDIRLEIDYTNRRKVITL